MHIYGSYRKTKTILYYPECCLTNCSVELCSIGVAWFWKVLVTRDEQKRILTKFNKIWLDLWIFTNFKIVSHERSIYDPSWQQMMCRSYQDQSRWLWFQFHQAADSAHKQTARWLAWSSYTPAIHCMFRRWTGRGCPGPEAARLYTTQQLNTRLCPVFETRVIPRISSYPWNKKQ